jgi:hypothetical protein
MFRLPTVETQSSLHRCCKDLPDPLLSCSVQAIDSVSCMWSLLIKRKQVIRPKLESGVYKAIEIRVPKHPDRLASSLRPVCVWSCYHASLVYYVYASLPLVATILGLCDPNSNAQHLITCTEVG